MRFYTVNVNLAGDRNHVVVKPGVTAAEILVLQAIHGGASVTNIKLDKSEGIDSTPHADIITALASRYNRARDRNSEPPVAVLPRIFPGWPNVKIPADVKAANISADYMAGNKSESEAEAIAAASTQAELLAAANARAEAAEEKVRLAEEAAVKKVADDQKAEKEKPEPATPAKAKAAKASVDNDDTFLK